MQVNKDYSWGEAIEILRNDSSLQQLIVNSYRTTGPLGVIAHVLLIALDLLANIINTWGEQLPFILAIKPRSAH